ncbi:MAG: FAD-dependent oxidoreductase [Proteobacteria bacterium]|nr:FAD-dependent oxidoreductase [Pseudomonadota bacterium]
MQKNIEIKVEPKFLEDKDFHLKEISKQLKVKTSEITDVTLLRRSIDARTNPPLYVLRYLVYIGESKKDSPKFQLSLNNIKNNPPVIIVGFGPAGMFAALKLIELGLKPIVLERGKAVRDRRHDIAAICKDGVVNPESNYCFGEGGAGTFSDGKLYTRSNKRGSTERVLQILVEHGATEDILIDAHPHIGTNKLPKLVQSIRESIIAHGGEVHFNTKVTEILKSENKVKGVKTASGDSISAPAVILATGHSARDVYLMLQQSEIKIEQKPFALGVRVEHPQEIINKIQYRSNYQNKQLPNASYSLVTQCENHGVFSFCMCPGGIICPAATSDKEIVVNGWSPSKRNSYFANSGIVTEIKDNDLKDFTKDKELAGISLQRSIEEKAFILGGGKQVAPAQRLVDFIKGKYSQSLPETSYLPGIKSVNLNEVFPKSIYKRLAQGFTNFSEKKNYFLSEEAVVLAVESRTSSPVRIPREQTTLMHPQLSGLFPSGEGGGYAGGIMSAAMDGENVAAAVKIFFESN